MSDEPLPTPRLPPEPLRQVDWMAIAPWLLVLRSVGLTIGWPLLWGAVGMVLLEWPGDTLEAGKWGGALARAHRELLMWPVSLHWWSRSIHSTSWFFLLFWPLLRLLGWLLLGSIVARYAVAGLRPRSAQGPSSHALQAVRSAPRLLGAVGLIAVPVVSLVVAMRVVGFLAEATGIGAGVLWGPAALFGGLPLAGLLAVGLFASPLLVASIVIDECDPFDAVSRTFAYTLQRPGTLALCCVLAWGGAVVAGAVVDWLTDAAMTLTRGLVGSPNDAEGGLSLWLVRASYLTMRGFFPAYIFSAGVTTYLVMRHTIDGQPLDELAPTYDASPEA